MEQNLEPQSGGWQLGRLLEWALVLIGAFMNTVIVVIFAAQQAAFPGGTALENLFPFPLLYFIEIIALSFLAVLSLISAESEGNHPSRAPALIWIAAGALLAFVILGGFSIGFYLIPGMLAFIAAAILADRRQNIGIVAHVGIFFLTAIAQAAILLLMVAWF
jgi:hypothetical protein